MSAIHEIESTCTWKIASHLGFPDVDITVLIALDSGEVEAGFHDGDWRFLNGGKVDEEVIAWADMPAGPFA